jgi:hypothetical protein
MNFGRVDEVSEANETKGARERSELSCSTPESVKLE